eukprot:4622506-Alexandrium_andersonii.AAC.1
MTDLTIAALDVTLETRSWTLPPSESCLGPCEDYSNGRWVFESLPSRPILEDATFLEVLEASTARPRN